MTAQVLENLILDGQATSIAFCPPLPLNDSRVVALKYDEIDGGGILISSACWRQYVGTWEIKDNKFYLVNLRGRLKLVEQTPILADWFTGTLRIPMGNTLRYRHIKYGSVYEREMHIDIENGKVIQSRNIDNRNKYVNEGELELKRLQGSDNRLDDDMLEIIRRLIRNK